VKEPEWICTSRSGAATPSHDSTVKSSRSGSDDLRKGGTYDGERREDWDVDLTSARMSVSQLMDDIIKRVSGNVSMSEVDPLQTSAFSCEPPEDRSTRQAVLETTQVKKGKRSDAK
jgi:hypothetical protein